MALTGSAAQRRLWYNPISVAYTLAAKSKLGFKATWATTGRPSMLMNYLKREDMLRIDPERL